MKNVLLSTKERTIIFYEKIIRLYEEYDVFSNGVFHEACLSMTERYNFFIAYEKQDYKTMIKKRNRKYFRNVSLKTKLKIYSCAFFRF